MNSPPTPHTRYESPQQRQLTHRRSITIMKISPLHGAPRLSEPSAQCSTVPPAKCTQVQQIGSCIPVTDATRFEDEARTCPTPGLRRYMQSAAPGFFRAGAFLRGKPLRQFGFANSNHRSYPPQTQALHPHLSWRDANARHPRRPRCRSQGTRPHPQRRGHARRLLTSTGEPCAARRSPAVGAESPPDDEHCEH